MLINSGLTSLGREGTPGPRASGSLGLPQPRLARWHGCAGACWPGPPRAKLSERCSPCGAPVRAGPGFAEAPRVAASRGGRAGRGGVSPRGEASLDSPGCATESQILRRCSRSPTQKRASQSWVVSEAFEARSSSRLPGVKVRSNSSQTFALLGEPAAAPGAPVLGRPGGAASPRAHQRGCGAPSRPPGRGPRAVRQYVRFNKSSYVGVSTQP